MAPQRAGDLSVRFTNNHGTPNSPNRKASNGAALRTVARYLLRGKHTHRET